MPIMGFHIGTHCVPVEDTGHSRAAQDSNDALYFQWTTYIEVKRGPSGV
jgi:hypothetical protein